MGYPYFWKQRYPMWPTFTSAACGLLHCWQRNDATSFRKKLTWTLDRTCPLVSRGVSRSTLPSSNQQLKMQLPKDIWKKSVDQKVQQVSVRLLCFSQPNLHKVSVRLLCFSQPNLHKITLLPLSQATLLILPSNAIRRQDQLSPRKPRPTRTGRNKDMQRKAAAPKRQFPPKWIGLLCIPMPNPTETVVFSWFWLCLVPEHPHLVVSM